MHCQICVLFTNCYLKITCHLICTYELKRSLLLRKWPVFLLNVFGNPIPKIYHFHNFPPIVPVLQKKVVPPLNEHGDVIETQTTEVCSPGPCPRVPFTTLRGAAS